MYSNFLWLQYKFQTSSKFQGQKSITATMWSSLPEWTLASQSRGGGASGLYLCVSNLLQEAPAFYHTQQKCFMCVLGTGWHQSTEERGEEPILLGLTQALHKLFSVLREPPPLKLRLVALTQLWWLWPQASHNYSHPDDPTTCSYTRDQALL